MKISDGSQSVEIIKKIRNYVKFVVLLDDTHEYLKVCE